MPFCLGLAAWAVCIFSEDAGTANNTCHLHRDYRAHLLSLVCVGFEDMKHIEGFKLFCGKQQFSEENPST